MAQGVIQKTRRGGRRARKEMRATPVTSRTGPIRAGMESRQQFKPLNDNEVLRIHNAALDVLEQVGIGECMPSTIKYLSTVGCDYNAKTDRITFPREVIENTLKIANRDFLLVGRDPRHDMHMKGSRVHFGTAGASPNMLEARTGEYRGANLMDLYNSARIADTLENVHFFQRTVVPREFEDFFELDFNTCYACLAGTQKHVGTSWGDVPQLKASIEMMHMIAGGERAWRERPFVSMSCCFTVSPLKWAQDSCSCLEVGAKAGMPILLVSLGQAGATSPAALAGTVVTVWAEVLAGLTYVNSVVPGHPTIIGTWPFVSDLRTGAMCCGSGEQALLTSACGQMARHFDLITGIPAGISDSKMPDAQSGYEKALNHVVTANSGANLVYEAGGMVGSLMGYSLEALTMDNDSIGAALRVVRGIEVTDDALSVDVIRDCCIDGPGHFLAHQQTLNRMESDFHYPKMNDRMSPIEWVEKNQETALDRAVSYVDHTLKSHYPIYIPTEIDDAIRARFPVRLERSRMMPDTG